MKPFLILVAGGSASGKSTVVKEIIKKAGLKDVIIIKHDDYYHDQKELSFEEKLNQNYDHPNSLDNELLVKHIKDLISEKTIQKPKYDFVNYSRLNQTEEIKPKKVIIVEGILILHDESLRSRQRH